MEPITNFVVKYAPEILKRTSQSNLREKAFDKMEITPESFKDLADDLKVEFLVYNASIPVWYTMRDVCPQSVMDIAARIKLKHLGFFWLRENGACNRLFAHLFDQAIHNTAATKAEIDELIACKRQHQFRITAMTARSQSRIEEAALRVISFFRYQLVLGPFNYRNINIPQWRIPLTQLSFYAGTYCFVRFYLFPRILENISRRSINYLINRLPAKAFPLFFKIYDTSWYINLLPTMSQNMANRNVFYKTACSIHVGIKHFFSLPGKVAAFTSNHVFNLTYTCIAALEKVEDYSELSRYQREITQVRTLWLTHQTSPL